MYLEVDSSHSNISEGQMFSLSSCLRQHVVIMMIMMIIIIMIMIIHIIIMIIVMIVRDGNHDSFFKKRGK